jgi:hypothetical protein
VRSQARPRALLPQAEVDLATLFAERAKSDVDFAEVKGQAHAKRALEVAAAGGHIILRWGEPRPQPLPRRLFRLITSLLVHNLGGMHDYSALTG